MNIAGHPIGEGNPPYIVAEIGASHNGNLRRALDLVKVAADCGADAVKTQLYDPSLVAKQRARLRIVWEGKLMSEEDLADLYSRAYTPVNFIAEMFGYAERLGIPLFSSVFHDRNEDFHCLMAWNCPAYKISAYEGNDFALIRKAASTGLPVIISVRPDENPGKAYVAAIEGGAAEIAILHCVSKYPCPDDEAETERIKELRKQFPVVGFSDHTLGNEAALKALGCGAVIFEKHIKLWGDTSSPDHRFAITPDEFRDYVATIRSAYAKRRAA